MSNNIKNPPITSVITKESTRGLPNTATKTPMPPVKPPKTSSNNDKKKS